MKVNPLLAALLASTLSIAGPTLAQTTSAATKSPVATRTIKVLPPAVSRSLAITRIPTSQPVPLLVGVYWSCDYGAADCRLVLVVCTDDQSQCVEV